MLKSQPHRLIIVHFADPRDPREIQGHKDLKVNRDFRVIKALKDQPVMEFL